MKLVIQRVNKASVTVKNTNKVVGKIEKGLFILFGVKKGDTKEKVDELVKKVSKLRIMSDVNNKMNLSIVDTNSNCLVVSQFTLYANTKDGNRPSFIEVEEPIKAKEIYEYFIEKLKLKNIHVETGEFGEYMEIDTFLDGPVTIILEN
ncbi:D-tyrosyl-tRNA(Tyr) deacylase [Candidatus Woesebacteria bacterium RIFOXYC1_FULL_31_51]|uniref:D-aminoacyl-tRNA deacylase n=1 Tax=Candidatus Woesebacteria bacterium GW2011_GWC2_31_9 TaxID=1618586 RepID=A0A0G0B022_9BACT|nr:MAG: D-tyrosyl-tRNA(Tyr) deacylase, D-tyrosyl-tRNA(Tyr) deacylase [Candidatus Woesebacteria bacterium GW2011_GWF1_31_35]KKP26125.1 MAG: D-tyrosyl-tRNA(Tyr) deacylase [Candidatus Woesebacteria bacterium GW2011_GWD1_31_12]KKP27618.1 MAG: D-tyrosyl-tRNA(Tyr) deacylase [Candidatus Woesebacteria bacterium GW2011_GWB1_31_29]KKP32135.1 MAG: D-tyrosyl-tRNA(Tyr) deacylase [Candidatus Woesebacteria bacterium GW2011_GWC2_31_9]KKP34325.1 MAG: D-tyrosyl-tRNA(Tyr) deacylase [Candidatus Woesebacteria bacte